MLTLAAALTAQANPGFVLPDITDGVSGTPGRVNANLSGGALDNSKSCCQYRDRTFGSGFAEQATNARGTGIAYGIFTNGDSGSKGIAVLLGTDASDVTITGATSTNAGAPNGRYITATTAGAMSATVFYRFNGNWFSFTLSKNANSNTLIGSTIQSSTPPPDITSPTLTAFERKTPERQATDADTLVFGITFDEDVRNVDASDFEITGTTATGVLAGSGAAYTLTVSGGDLAGLEGIVGVDLKNTQNVTDVAGNVLSSDEPPVDETYNVTQVTDDTPPSKPGMPDMQVGSDSGVSDTDNITNVRRPVFVGRTEPRATVSVRNRGVEFDTVVANEAGEYSVTPSTDLSGDIRISVTATDLFGNISVPSDELVGVIDAAKFTNQAIERQDPTVETVSAGANTELVFRLTFSEAVGFPQEAVSLGGSAGSKWEVKTVNPVPGETDKFDVIVRVKEGSDPAGRLGVGLSNKDGFTDLAGNSWDGRYGTDQAYTISTDETAPTGYSVSIDQDGINVNNDDALSFTLADDEIGATYHYTISSSGGGDDVTGSGTVTAVSSRVTGIDVSTLGDGTLTLSVMLTDPAGNEGVAATDTVTKSSDATAPTVTVNLVDDALSNADKVSNVTFTFSEAVTGFAESDLTVTNGTLSDFSFTDGETSGSVTFTANDNTQETGSVSVTENSYADLAGNNGASGSDTVNIDTAAPTLTAFARKTPSDATTDADALVFDITFNEDVQNVDASDFEITGTTATGVLAGSGAAYTLTVSGGDLASLTGTVGLNLKTGHGIADSAGNALPDGEPATDESYTLANDTTAPAGYSVTLDQDPVTVNNNTAVSFTFAGAEPNATYNYTISSSGGGADVTGNGTIATATDQITGVDVSALGDGTLTLSVKLTDPVGNVGSATTDTATKVPAPAVTLSGGGSASEAIASRTITATLSSAATTDTRVSLSYSGTATGGGTDYTGLTELVITAGATTGTVNLAVVNDEIVERTETVIVDISGVSGGDGATENGTQQQTFSVENDDRAAVTIADVSANEDTGKITVTLTLDKAVDGGLSVGLSVDNATATRLDNDYAGFVNETKTFAGTAGETRTHDITVGVDTKVEADETILLSMSNLVATGVSVDDISITDTATATIKNDDTAAVTIADVSAAEDTGTVTLTLRLDRAVDGGFSIDLAANDGTATRLDNDYAGFAGDTKTFVGTADEIQKRDIVLGPDTMIEPNETFTVSMSNLVTTSVDGAAVTISDIGTVTILNDDFDRTSPTVAITSEAMDPVSGQFTVKVTFSEAVTGFDRSDVTVGNGTVSNFAGSGTTYTADITPTSDGQVTVNVAAGAAQDGAGNDNSAADQLSRTADGTAPTFTTISIASNNANKKMAKIGDTITLSLTAGEALKQAPKATFAGQAMTVTGSGATYTATLVVNADTPHEGLSFTISDIEDRAGNKAGDISQSGRGGKTTDGTFVQTLTKRPTVSDVSRAEPRGEVTSADSLRFIVFFGYNDVTNAAVTDFVVTGADGLVTSAAVQKVDVSNNTVFVTVSGGDLATFNGVVGIKLSPTVGLTDLAGNVVQSEIPAGVNVATFTVQNDVVAPTVALSTSSSDPVSGAFTVTATFSETVIGFEQSDISVTNASLSNFKMVTPAIGTYTVDVSPTADGTVTIDVAAGVAQDAAGNDNTAADQLSRTADGTAPTVVLSTSSSDPVSGAFTVTATFSEDVTGFEQSDFTVGNGTASNFASTSPSVYIALIMPTADGLVTVNVAAGVAQDVAGNNNTAAEQLSRTADGTAPTVVLSTSSSDPVSGAFTVTATFSEAVTDFILADFIVGNGSASDFAGSGATYTALITPASDGLVTVDVAAGAAQDSAGNGNSAANQLPRTADGTAPTLSNISIKSDNADMAYAKLGDKITVSFDVGEALADGVGVTIAGKHATLTQTGLRYSADVTVDGTMQEGRVGFSFSNIADKAGNILANPLNVTTDGSSVHIDRSSEEAKLINRVTQRLTHADTLDFSILIKGSLTHGGTAAHHVPAKPSDFIVTGDANGTTTASVTAVKVENRGQLLRVTVSGGDLAEFNGTVGLDFAPGHTIIDQAGNAMTTSGVKTKQAYTVDNTIPSLVLSSSAADPVLGAFTVTATFSEAVTGFEQSDFTVGNGAASAFKATSGTVYTVLITPASDGQLTVDVAAGVAQDAAGNDNSTADQLSRTADGTAPTVALSTDSSDPVSGAFIVTATFSEDVTGFALGKFTVGNGAASAFKATSGTVYTALITPASDGQVTVDVAAGVVQDAAGNDNTAAETLSRTADGTAPTVALSTSSSDPVSGAFTVTATFSEAVTGFEQSDFTVGNGAASAFKATSGATYTALITPASDGQVTVDVAAGAAQDSAGNDSTVAETLSRTADGTAPTVALSTSSSDPVSGAFTVTATFSEDVTGFEQGDFTVGNGAASNFASTSPSVYTVLITPASDGQVTVDVAAGVAQDAAGNDNTAADQLSRTADGTAPTVVLSSSSSDPVSGAFTVTATFSEAVTGFEQGDFTVGNGSASDFAGKGTTYTATITPTADGQVTVDVAAGVAQDVAGNDNSAAEQLSRTADGTAPTVALSTGSTDPVSGAFTVTATFSEAVTGFEQSDFTIGNGSASAFAGSGATYTGLITPTADGQVTVDVAAGVAQDAAGNDNTAAPQFAIQADGTAPTVALSTGASDPVSGAFTVTATFSEAVTGFEQGDFTVGNGAASTFASTSPSVYTALITPTADGEVTVNIAAGVAQDAAGNDNTAAEALSRTADGTAPTVTLSTGSSDPVSGAFTVTATFSEAVTGFEQSDFTVGNGAASNFASTSPSVYTVLITPASDGQVRVDVAAGAAKDAAGNDNTVAETLSRTADGTAPTVALSTGSTDPVSGAFTVTATFSEDVTGFEQSDFTVGNGAASAFKATSGTVYTALITPTADGQVTVDVAAGAAQDAAGNNNTAADQLSRTADGTAPTVALSTGSSDPVSGAFTVTATFSEAVTGFEQGDFAVGNGAASNFASTSPSVYTVLISPASDGQVTVDVAAGAAKDAAGNDNTVAETLSRTADGTAPTVILSTDDTEVTGPFSLTVTFSEPVTGFDITDLVIVNGAASDFVGALTDFTVTVTPETVGDVIISLADNAAQDIAGNGSAAASQTVVATGGEAEVTLTFTGSDATSEETGGTFVISNPGSETLAFTAQADQAWVDVTPESGVIDSLSNIEFDVSLNDGVNDLPPGTHTATVSVTVVDTPVAAKSGAAAQSTAARVLAVVPITVDVEERFGRFTLITRTPSGLSPDTHFTYESDIAAVNGHAVAVNAGEARLTLDELERGTYTVTQLAPDGYRVEAINCVGDADNGSNVDLGAGQLTLDVDVRENLVCTFENVRDDQAIRIATQRTIRDFMARRGDRLLEAAPDLSDRFRDRDSTDAGGFSALGNYRGTRMSLNSSVAGFRNRAAQAAVGDNAHLMRPTFGQWDLWVGAEYSKVKDDRNNRGIEGEFFNAQIGLDKAVTSDLIVGGLAQYDWAQEDDKVIAEGVGAVAGASVKGDGFMVGPYAVWKADDSLILDVMGLWGSSDNKINPLGYYEDSFKTRRFMLRANVTGEYENGPWRIRPQIGWSHYEDHQKDYTDSLGIYIPEQTVTIGRLRAGPEILWRQTYESGSMFELGGSVRAVWDYDGPGRLSRTGVLSSGADAVRADGRLSARIGLANGVSVRGEMGLSGIGQGDFSAQSGRLEIVFPFGGNGGGSSAGAVAVRERDDMSFGDHCGTDLMSSALSDCAPSSGLSAQPFGSFVRNTNGLQAHK